MAVIRRRRNGLVRVPKLWLDATVEAYVTLDNAGGGKIIIPLPVKSFPYARIREALKPIYPDKAIPLYFSVGMMSAEGSTSTKTQGGYKIGIKVGLPLEKAASTILHEFRHLVQHVGDEVVKSKSGTFGRPSKAATASLRARKKAIKSGQIAASSYAAYLTSASEWQPWVGSTADKIVGKILAGKLDKTSEVNAAIRAGVTGSTFYKETDPTTRKELMRQVYTEVVRQLKGYTDIVPAKHAKPSAAAPPPKAATATPPPPPPGTVTPQKGGAYIVRVKIEGANPSIANEPNYAGKDSKGRDKLEIGGFTGKEAAYAHAESIVKQVQGGTLFHGGKVYAVRVYSTGSGKEVDFSLKPPESVKAPASAAGPGWAYVDKSIFKAAVKAAKEGAKAKAAPKPKAPKSDAEAMELLKTIIPASFFQKKYVANYGPVELVAAYFELDEYEKPNYWLAPNGEKEQLCPMDAKSTAVLKAIGWKKLTGAQWLGKAPLPKANPRRTRRPARRRTR